MSRFFPTTPTHLIVTPTSSLHRRTNSDRATFRHSVWSSTSVPPTVSFSIQVNLIYRAWDLLRFEFRVGLGCLQLFLDTAVMAFKRSIAVLGAFALAPAAVAKNRPIPQPACDGTKSVDIRYSGASKRLYVEGAGGVRGGCVTLSQIYETRVGKPPLYPVNPVSGARTTNVTGTWLLTESLHVEDGITLNVSRSSWIGMGCGYAQVEFEILIHTLTTNKPMRSH